MLTRASVSVAQQYRGAVEPPAFGDFGQTLQNLMLRLRPGLRLSLTLRGQAPCKITSRSALTPRELYKQPGIVHSPGGLRHRMYAASGGLGCVSKGHVGE